MPSYGAETRVRMHKTKFLTENKPCTDGCCEPSNSINLFEYEYEDELNAITEEIEIEVANDSGSCAHVVGPDQVPATVEVKRSPECKNFTGAGGTASRTMGEPK